MVQKGLFSVELTDAKSKEILLEHKATISSCKELDLDVFVEVEPAAEYFIRVANDSSESVICNLSVDGEDLGYEFVLNANEYDDKGVWKFENGTSRHTALKVHKVSVSSDASSDVNKNIGVVAVNFFKYIEDDGVEIKTEFKSNWGDSKESLGSRIDIDDSKKLVMSQQGTYTENCKEDDGKRKCYTYGDEIVSIRLKYCTTVGLIVDGVLQKPPLWEYARMLKTNNNETGEKEGIETVHPKIIKRNTCDEKGNVIEEKEIEFFDLTAMEE